MVMTMNFGDKLRYLRDQHNLTQNDIAQILGVSRQAYTKYESNQAEPDMKALKKLSEYFNVTADYLLGTKYSSVKIIELREEMERLNKLLQDSLKKENAIMKMLNFNK
jgi:transcriptional regulator with XRE-family HTH domain